MTVIVRRLTALLAGLALILAATAPPAEAGTLCNISSSMCGTVTNRADSKGSVVVSNGWDSKKKRLAGKTCVLSPGQQSARKCGQAFGDTDGVRIPRGLVGKLRLKNGKGGIRYRTLRPGDHKIRDGENWSILVVKG